MSKNQIPFETSAELTSSEIMGVAVLLCVVQHDYCAADQLSAGENNPFVAS